MSAGAAAPGGALQASLARVLEFIKAGDYDVALSTCRDLAEQHPQSAEPVHLAGYLHQLRNEHQDAIRCFSEAAQLDPKNAEIANNHGASLKSLGLLAEAERYFLKAIELDPGNVLPQHNLADLLLQLERTAEAIARSRKVLELDPDFGQTCLTLGAALERQGRFDEAIAAYRDSARRGGNPVTAAFGEALVRLSLGEYAAGWDKYEARLDWAEHARNLHERFAYPRWRGASLAGRTLLVTREQGLGDEIMFASCFAEVLGVAGRCLITCDERLEALFARSFPRATVLSGDQAALDARLAGERVDFQIPAGSLPLVFRSSPAEFPRHEGYLRADAARVDYWRGRLAGLGAGRPVGLAWRGGLPSTGQARRSMPLGALRAVLETPGVRFVSLQHGDTVAEEIRALEAAHGIRVAHWPEAVESIDEMAALVCALDLVVSVCTAAVHLSGALGRPAWVMVPWAAEWRYGARGEAMPWYPSVRLLRQATAGDWSPVLERVRAELAAR